MHPSSVPLNTSLKRKRTVSDERVSYMTLEVEKNGESLEATSCADELRVGGLIEEMNGKIQSEVHFKVFLVVKLKIIDCGKFGKHWKKKIIYHKSVLPHSKTQM